MANIDFKKYMKMCISLAKKGEGKVSPNPLVGAVVLDKEGNIIGKGWHKKFGEAHAEPNALALAGDKAEGGTIIVSLEPCSHYGKNPPCADLIIAKKLKRVVIGCVDPNPIVSGRGIKKLQDAGIEVITGVLEEECKTLNEIFIKNQTKKLPFIAIKSATTMDGKIAAKTGSSKWITGEKARARVQKLRNKYDAILTGSGTVLADNPSLTCRMRGGRNPIRVIVDSKLKTPSKAKVYDNDGTRVIIAAGENTSTKHIAELITCPLIDGKIDLKFLVLKLYEQGITSILIEAGGELNGAFIKAGLVDKIYQFIAPKILGDSEGKNFIEGYDLTDINDCLKMRLQSVKSISPDLLTESYIQSI